jgi:hypothetical protein
MKLDKPQQHAVKVVVVQKGWCQDTVGSCPLPDQMASATAVVDVIVVGCSNRRYRGGVNHVCVRYGPNGSECAMGSFTWSLC